MLKRMKAKNDWTEYTFGECCLFVLMILCAAVSLFGGLGSLVLALATRSYSPLVWLMPCVVVAVLSYAGLIYVLDLGV